MRRIALFAVLAILIVGAGVQTLPIAAYASDEYSPVPLENIEALCAGLEEFCLDKVGG